MSLLLKYPENCDLGVEVKLFYFMTNCHKTNINRDRANEFPENRHDLANFGSGIDFLC